MGVLVANRVTKSGNGINGNWSRIVVVRTDAGYAPTPGRAGTGTIVATFRQYGDARRARDIERSLAPRDPPRVSVALGFDTS